VVSPTIPPGGKPVPGKTNNKQHRLDLLADFQAFLMSEAATWNMVLAGELHHKPEDRLTIIEHQCQYVRKQLAKLDG